MVAINRPLNDPERHLLLALTIRVVCDRYGLSLDEASSMVGSCVDDGQLRFDCDSEHVSVVADGVLLLDARRDWLAFHAAYPGNDPMVSERYVKIPTRQGD